MEAIGRFTVALVVFLSAYIVLRLLLSAVGIHVQSDASYCFGFVMGAINLMISRAVAK